MKLWLGWSGFNTEGTEEEHRGHGEEHTQECLCDRAAASSGDGSVVAGGEENREPEGEEDACGGDEEEIAIACVADDGAGDRSGKKQREIDEGVVGAEGGAAIFVGDVADGFDGQRWKNQGIADADQTRGHKSGGGNARESEQKETEDFYEERNKGDGEAPNARDQAVEQDACDDEASSIEGERECSAGPMKLREIEGDECGENSEANSAEGQYGAVGSDAPENVRERKMP